MDGDVYFKVIKDKNDYLGERYFKINWYTDRCVQVCVKNGSVRRRGKGNQIGVYMIGKLTILSNYLGMNYLEPTTKRQFQNKLDHVIKMIR